MLSSKKYKLYELQVIVLVILNGAMMTLGLAGRQNFLPKATRLSVTY